MNIDYRAVIGARNNADLYEVMFEVQGLRCDRLPFAFVSRDQPPPFYANLSVISPHRTQEVEGEIIKLSEKFGAMGLKDSFCQLDLSAYGFDTLFNASWIWKDAGDAVMPDNWQRVETEEDLILWEDAWKMCGSPTPHKMFTPAVLDRTDIQILGRKDDGGFQAGCIANQSANCLGLSNVFSRDPKESIFTQAAAATGSFDPAMPIVGYESGNRIDFARQSGFTTVGDLRILVTRAVKV